jgi:iron complex outermembrane receptor protein
MFLNLTALFLCAAAWSQGKIEGLVLNEEKEPIVGARIEIPGTYYLAFSGNDGKFLFPNVNLPVVNMLISYAGFETYEATYQPGKSSLGTFVLIRKTAQLTEVVVSVSRVTREPVASSTVSKATLTRLNFGQDLPLLLETSPSAVSSSDAGAGIGYTGLRIRGVDPTRTNVTINGIPINDAESHGVYWVNMPDFASSVENIQIQRGVGTSVNGAAAFGASINIQTDALAKESYATLDNSVGSFGTWKSTVKAGTGLIDNRFSMDVRLSRIVSDGYLDRAASNLRSFYIGAQYNFAKSVLKANVFSGRETTYQAWEGTPESRIKNDVAGMNAFADRNYLTDEQRENLLNAGRTYNLYTYDNQVDNYGQDHYQLHFIHTFNKKLIMNISGHYTYGAGYYEQYRADDALSDYGLPAVVVGSDTIATSNLIRRKWLKNQFYGAVYSLSYQPISGLNITFGGAANRYDGDHYGEIIWAQYASTSNIRQRYYADNALKTEFSNYLKATYSKGKFFYYADAQYRFINYNYLGTSEVNGALVESQETTTFSFFNPKVGLAYTVNSSNKLTGSYAVGNREPVRDDFRQPVGGKKPVAEQLHDLELGYTYSRSKVMTKVNMYWMNYKNQLILTGQLNDVGGYTRTNVAKSYRLGVELEAGYKITQTLDVAANLTVSQNKVVAFNEYVDDYDNGGQLVIPHSNTDLAFSPNVIAALILQWSPIKGLEASWTAKYVGKQYLDNTSDETRKIDQYLTNNLGVSYTLPTSRMKQLKVGVLVNNLFNYTYENNGYTYSYLYGGSTTTENFYYPQAGRNFLVRLTCNF